MTKGCPKCGRFVEETVEVCPYCNYNFSEIEKFYKNGGTQKKLKKNAGLFQRLTAFSFDMFLMSCIFMCLIYIFKMPLNYQNLTINNGSFIFLSVIITIVYFFYCVILEATSLKGTIGARILGIMVVDDGGYQISFTMSFKRNIAKLLNVLTFYIGYFALVFTKHKQTLSDYVSDTYVENRTLEYNTRLYYANTFLRLLAFIIDLLILWFIYFIINSVLFYFINKGMISNIVLATELIGIFKIIIYVFYFSFMDSKDGTFGKRLFSFRVTNLKGEDISCFKSFLRVLLMFFEIVFIPVGILLCQSIPTKQTFKDVVTKTVLVKMVYYK